MTDIIVIVGAGPGVGMSVARRFAAEGFAVGLIARDARRLAAMAGELTADGIPVATGTADARDPDQLGAALLRVGRRLGPPSVLCFSPLPAVSLIRPVLDSGPEELMDSLRLGVAGAATAVRAVLPAMLRRRAGTLLFTTGSGAVRPSPDRAASAVTTTATTSYVSLLHEALSETGITVGHTVIEGPIGAGGHHPDAVATDLWQHHANQERPRTVLRR